MSNKEIAVLIAVFNNQKGLDESILSISGKDKEIVDIVVVDDGSSPAMHLNNLPEHQIKLIRLETNKGVQYAANAGMSYILEKGYSYTARLDAGDTIVTGRFIKQLDFLKHNSSYGVVGSYIKMFSPTGEISTTWCPPVEDMDIRKAMHLNSAIAHPASMFSNMVIRKIGMYNLFYSAALDYDLFFRILKVSKGYNIPETLINYEVMNTQSISYKKRFRQTAYRLIIQLNNFDCLYLNSYIGVIRSVITLSIPYRLSYFIKNLITKLFVRG